jgi:Acetokinase family
MPCTQCHTSVVHSVSLKITIFKAPRADATHFMYSTWPYRWHGVFQFAHLHIQVAFFDTAFPVSSMPPVAYTYALPTTLADREGLRR